MRIDPSDVLAPYRLFERDGYINDENSRLGSGMFERHCAELDIAFRLLGYTGPALFTHGHYYPDHGAVYWVFDSNRMDMEEARALTDKWVKDYPPL